MARPTRTHPHAHTHRERESLTTLSPHRDKVGTKVDFPVTGLDLSPYVNQFDPAKPPIYDLYAVSVRWPLPAHLGGASLLRSCD